MIILSDNVILMMDPKCYQNEIASVRGAADKADSLHQRIECIVRDCECLFNKSGSLGLFKELFLRVIATNNSQPTPLVRTARKGAIYKVIK